MAVPAQADALIDNVNGITLDEDGDVVHFTGLLMTTDGRITKLLGRKDKRPEKLDWRTDMHGKVMLPGLVAAHGHIMDLGFRSMALDLSDTHSLAEAPPKIPAYAVANPARPSSDHPPAGHHRVPTSRSRWSPYHSQNHYPIPL